MANSTINQIVEQIRTAVYGRDVRENIAQGIEICYDDVTTGTTTALAAANTAEAAVANANASATAADNAALAANTAASGADLAAAAAQSATGAANTAASKINDMTVEATGLTPSDAPTVTVTEVDGHKHISFGIPKGNTGNTPDIEIGTVTSVGPTQPAEVDIEGTAETPVLNFRIPRGYDGSSVLSNRIWECATPAATSNKIVTVTTESFSLQEGGLFIISFDYKNTADSPTLNIGSTGAKPIYINGDQIGSGYNKNLIAGVCLFIYDGTNYNLVGNFYNEANAEISNDFIDGLFSDDEEDNE